MEPTEDGGSPLNRSGRASSLVAKNMTLRRLGSSNSRRGPGPGLERRIGVIKVSLGLILFVLGVVGQKLFVAVVDMNYLVFGSRRGRGVSPPAWLSATSGSEAAEKGS